MPIKKATSSNLGSVIFLERLANFLVALSKKDAKIRQFMKKDQNWMAFVSNVLIPRNNCVNPLTETVFEDKNTKELVESLINMKAGKQEKAKERFGAKETSEEKKTKEENELQLMKDKNEDQYLQDLGFFSKVKEDQFEDTQSVKDEEKEKLCKSILREEARKLGIKRKENQSKELGNTVPVYYSMKETGLIEEEPAEINENSSLISMYLQEETKEKVCLYYIARYYSFLGQCVGVC